MREAILKQFFEKSVSVETLAEDLIGTVARIDDIASSVFIEDMDTLFSLRREHVISLCNAAILGQIPPDALSTVAFALIASDHFEWDDEVISEVLWDWSCPEINLPLNAENLNAHREWLSGRIVSRPSVQASREKLNGKLLSDA